MSTFRIGQKVVCIDAYHPLLTLNAIYPVTGIDKCCKEWIAIGIPDTGSGTCCNECGDIGPPEWEWWDPSAFRPLIEDLTAELARKEAERVQERPDIIHQPQPLES